MLAGAAASDAGQPGSAPFPSPFVFPNGQACRNFNQLSLACYQQWAAAIQLIKQGYLASFLGGIGRLDLAGAANEAARFPDPDRGLDLLLSRLPAQVLDPAKLKVGASEINLGVVPMGTNRSLDITLRNEGMRLCYGTVVSDSKWLLLGEGHGQDQKIFQFSSETTIPLHVRGHFLRAGPKPLLGHLVIESNAGNFTIDVKAEVPAIPYADGMFGGALAPRQIAEKAKAQPVEAAPYFEKGAVARWYAANGWPYPVQGPTVPGIGGVQQFFEALGLAKPPKVELRTTALNLRGDGGEALQATIEVVTTERKVVWVYATCDQPWVDVNKWKAGKIGVVSVSIPRVPNKPRQTITAKIQVTSNGNQRFTVPLTLAVGNPSPYGDEMPLPAPPPRPAGFPPGMPPLPAPTPAHGIPVMPGHGAPPPAPPPMGMPPLPGAAPPFPPPPVPIPAAPLPAAPIPLAAIPLDAAHGAPLAAVPILIDPGRGAPLAAVPVAAVPVAAVPYPVSAAPAVPVAALPMPAAPMPVDAFAHGAPPRQGAAGPAYPAPLPSPGRAAVPGAGTSRWVHFLPFAILSLVLLGLFLRDMIGTSPPVGELNIPIDDTKRVAVIFDWGPPGSAASARVGAPAAPLPNQLLFGVCSLSAKAAPEKNLTFDLYGRTNNLLFRIDGVDRKFGADAGDDAWIETPARPADPATKPLSLFGKGDLVARWKFGREKIVVTQTVKIVPGEPVVDPKKKDDLVRQLDTVLIRFTIENQDAKAHSIGLRVVWDTFIGANDGVPFTIPGEKTLIDTQRRFEKDAVPEFLFAKEDPASTSGTIVRINLKLGKEIESPDIVLLTRWPGQPDTGSSVTSWDIPGRDMRNDSAIVLYWSPKDLATGAKRDVGFTYGLGTETGDSGLSLSIGGEFSPNRPLSVVAQVEGDKDGRTAKIILPDGLKLLKREDEKEAKDTQPVPSPFRDGEGKLRPNPITWRIQAERTGIFPITVETSDGKKQTKRISISAGGIF